MCSEFIESIHSQIIAMYMQPYIKCNEIDKMSKRLAKTLQNCLFSENKS